MLKLSVIPKTIMTTALVTLLSAVSLASGPVFWEVSRQDDVLKGDARGISIADGGAITLAPAYELVYDTKEAYIWSTATDSRGNIYLGTGQEGRVYKVEPGGAGRMLYDSEELNVTAMASDPQGNIYAATSPDGKIYKITPAGQASVFYDPADKYIWSLIFDTRSSSLYAGTGDKGVIYRLDAQGKSTVFADTNETNIVSMALDRSGNLLAGTDPGGLVLRVSQDGKVFALLDSPAQEIHSLTVMDDGMIYALGINQTGGVTSQPVKIGSSSTSTLSGEGTVTVTILDENQQSSDLQGIVNQAQGQGKAEGAKSVVFRLDPEGGSEVRWRAPDTVAFAARPLADGRLLIGTGNRGRIYQVSKDRSQTLLIQSPEDQTSNIFAVGDTLYAASSNLGRLYRIRRDSVAEGTYTSTVRDTKFAGQWGVITWRGSGQVELQTRSGNTESPDATWSDWSASYKNPNGDQITSPRARFIQWRATLKGTRGAGASDLASTTKLESVVLAYLPRNQAPDIGSLSVLPPGVAFQEMPIAVDPSIMSSGLDPQVFGVIASVPPRRFYQKGARTISWQGADANDDTLTYSIYYRSIGDSEWHLLASDLSQAYYTIDGNRLPDGKYNFKVVASDATSNPAGDALTSEEVTSAVEVDNTSPVITSSAPAVTGQTAEITFDVADSTSRLVRGEYSVDGGAWKLIYPQDSVADTQRESFKVRVTFDKPGEHVIAFRCSDSSSNVGTSKVTVTTK
jgi:sugar lactone lactonase YvrE